MQAQEIKLPITESFRFLLVIPFCRTPKGLIFNIKLTLV
ncbi:hypothetical protein LDG_6254 [Legionella drancourtii LLAP12]|uniref:Uncharacterized protein n=1 Tax=Legionella drancourtii LLAP12 TaxID=658187 RepID=G9ELZ3_9GAMM|nr:hypothetical protein LDG_6254 [Legionella drancourtii LLAP12]